MNSLKKPFYSALVFFGTLAALSVGYAAYNLSTESANAPLTATKWNNMINAVNDLDTRVSSLIAGGANSWSAVTGGLSYTGGKVGIGTASPGKDLHIYNTVSNAEIDIQSVAGTNNHWGIYNDRTDNSLKFWNNTASNAVTILNNGNVGVGTVSPLAKLNIDDGYLLVRNFPNITGTSAIMIGSSINQTSYNNLGVSIGTIVESDTTNGYGMQFFTNKSYLTGQKEKMRITGDGNVGIGTTSPDTNVKLQVVGDIVGKAQVFKVYMTADFSKAASWEKLPFNATSYNTLQGTFDTTNNRFTASRAGYYQINTAGYSPTASTGNDRYGMAIYVNNVPVEITGGNYSIGDTPLVPLTGIVYLNGTTDYVEIYMYSAIISTMRGGSGMYGVHWYMNYLGN